MSPQSPKTTLFDWWNRPILSDLMGQAKTFRDPTGIVRSHQIDVGPIDIQYWWGCPTMLYLSSDWWVFLIGRPWGHHLAPLNQWGRKLSKTFVVDQRFCDVFGKCTCRGWECAVYAEEVWFLNCKYKVVEFNLFFLSLSHIQILGAFTEIGFFGSQKG